MDIAQDLWVALSAFWIAILILGAFMLGMFVLALRFGPRRGYWAQPAAKFEAPGRKLAIVLYCIAGLHVLAGVAASAADSIGPSVIVVAVAAALFYVGCAQAMSLAGWLGRAVDRRHGREAAPR